MEFVRIFSVKPYCSLGEGFAGSCPSLICSICASKCNIKFVAQARAASSVHPESKAVSGILFCRFDGPSLCSSVHAGEYLSYRWDPR